MLRDDRPSRQESAPEGRTSGPIDVTQPLPGGARPTSRSTPLSTRPPAHGEEGCFVVDELGTVLAFDAGMERLTGWRANEIVARSKSLGFYLEGGSRVPGYQSRPLFDGAVPAPRAPETRSIRLHCKNGRTLEVEVEITPIGGGPRVVFEVRRVLDTRPAPMPREAYDETDPLTKLPNAHVFHDALRENFHVAREKGHALSLLLVDVDREADLVRAHDKKSWERILHRVAEVLGACSRAGDLLVRLEGRTFALLCPRTGRGAARHLAGRLRNTVERFSIEADDERLTITVSVGLACFPGEGDTPLDLLRRSREALLEAHRLGSNRVWCYSRRPRLSLRVPVLVETAEGELVAESKDISNSGLFLKTEGSLPLGGRVGLSLKLPLRSEMIRVMARVARRDDSETGYALEFERYSDHDRWLLESFLHGHEDVRANA